MAFSSSAGSSVTGPCARYHCSFGARCVASADGRSARCQCDARCDVSDDVTPPVCGDDGLDYVSECELRRKACTEMRHIAKKYDGKCGQC